jgi:hypothetical protein
MKIISYKIDDFTVEIYAKDMKGGRIRWADKIIRIYSQGREVAQAVFSQEGSKAPEPYISGEIIHYFADSTQFATVLDLLRSEKNVYIGWKPISDPKEPNDGDAFFFTKPEE